MFQVLISRLALLVVHQRIWITRCCSPHLNIKIYLLFNLLQTEGWCTYKIHIKTILCTDVFLLGRRTNIPGINQRGLASEWAVCSSWKDLVSMLVSCQLHCLLQIYPSAPPTPHPPLTGYVLFILFHMLRWNQMIGRHTSQITRWGRNYYSSLWMADSTWPSAAIPSKDCLESR